MKEIIRFFELLNLGSFDKFVSIELKMRVTYYVHCTVKEVQYSTCNLKSNGIASNIIGANYYALSHWKEGGRQERRRLVTASSDRTRTCGAARTSRRRAASRQ